MKGTIRPISRQRKCLECGLKFDLVKKLGFICKKCKTMPTRFLIDLHYNGQCLSICSDKTGQALDTYGRCQTLQDNITAEINEHKFDPSKYIKAEQSKFYFRTRIDEWIKEKENNKAKGKIAPSTLKVYKLYVRNFYIPVFGSEDVREIRSVRIKEFFQQLPSSLSLKYQDCIIKTLENFFNSLVEDDIIDKKPSFKATEIAIPERTPEWTDRATQDHIIAKIEDERDKPPYIFLTRQGTRPSEARALKIKDLDLEQGTVTVCRTFSEHEIVERNKEKKIKTRLLNPELIPMLQELCKSRFPEEFVFVNWRTGKPYNRNLFNKIWNDASETAGVKIELYNGTRHSVGSQAARAGVSDSDIQGILNHADVRTSRKYVNRDDLERQRVIFEKINNVQPVKKDNAGDKP